MNTFLMALIVAFSLSMDAFSLALIYGTYGFGKREGIVLAVIVGMFHFFMPLIGVGCGSFIYSYFRFDGNLVVGVIFLIIGVEMIISSVKEEEVKELVGLGSDLLFGLSVSIDSLTTGIGLAAISDNYVGVAFLFMVVSGGCTYLGLRLGKKLNERFGRYATGGGGVMLIGLAIYYIFGR